MTTTLRWVTADGTTVPLDGTAGVRVVLPLLGLDAPPTTVEWEDRVAYDGAVAFRRRRPQRPIDLTVWIDTSVVGFGTVARWFIGAGNFTATQPTGGTLIATTAGTDRTLFDVHYDSGFEGEWSSVGGGIGLNSFRRFPLRLVAGDPWWYGPINSQELNFGAQTAFNAAVAFNAALPFDGGNSTLVPVAGDDGSFPQFVIDGPFTTLTLVGQDTGESITLSAALASGSQIVIDATPGNRGPRLNGGDVDWTLLSPLSRLFPLLRPSASVAINATGSTGASGVELRWRNRYLAP